MGSSEGGGGGKKGRKVRRVELGGGKRGEEGN